MKYIANCKYQLVEDYKEQLPIFIPETVSYGHIILNGEESFWEPWQRRVLHIEKGYAWDGPSGPVMDVSWLMTPSLVHDALYELMRWERLDISWRAPADKLFVSMAIARAPKDDKGIIEPWASASISTMWLGLYYCAGYAAKPENRDPIIEVN